MDIQGNALNTYINVSRLWYRNLLIHSSIFSYKATDGSCLHRLNPFIRSLPTYCQTFSRVENLKLKVVESIQHRQKCKLLSVYVALHLLRTLYKYWLKINWSSNMSTKFNPYLSNVTKYELPSDLLYLIPYIWIWIYVKSTNQNELI